MFRTIITIIFLGGTIGLIVFFVNPSYKDVKGLLEKQKAYEQALANSKELEKTTTNLRNRYQAVSEDDIKRLDILLPDYVNNVQLAIEIEKIALSYGMVLKNVKFELPETPAPGAPQTREQAAAAKRDYGIFKLTFSTEGSYTNFVSFLKDLERSLRLIDVESITFTVPELLGGAPPTSYKYEVKVKTYWLKNK